MATITTTTNGFKTAGMVLSNKNLFLFVGARKQFGNPEVDAVEKILLGDVRMTYMLWIICLSRSNL
jgi:hypothetical protein